MRIGRVAAIGLLLAVAWLSGTGCEKAPPPVIDPAKTPWFDPQSQLKGLNDGDYRIRSMSAFNLGNMGAKATVAIPKLERIARDDPNEKVRANAQEALAKIRAASK